ncbi:MAG: type II toxin-antitoxin system RelE/ParE family toxin [Lacipirellulaceae bacterium]
MIKKYEVEEYVAEDGSAPFGEWITALKDAKARFKLAARIDRAAFGNFGDWKAIAGASGLFEMREHYGPGYRIYYAIDQGKVIVLLAGSTKSDQQKVIATAKARLADHRQRSKEDDEKTN